MRYQLLPRWRGTPPRIARLGQPSAIDVADVRLVIPVGSSEPAIDRVPDQRRATMDAKLLRQVRDVAPDGVDADPEHPADLAGLISAREQGKDLALTDA